MKIACPTCGRALLRRQPTRAQARVYGFVAAFMKEHMYSPTFQEIADALGYSSLATVHKHIDGLEERGWIYRTPREYRAIEILAEWP